MSDGRKLALTLYHPPCAAPGGYLIFPGSWAKDGPVISLVIAMRCQRGGRAVTPSGPTTQQQMGHGRGLEL